VNGFYAMSPGDSPPWARSCSASSADRVGVPNAFMLTVALPDRGEFRWKLARRRRHDRFGKSRLNDPLLADRRECATLALS